MEQQENKTILERAYQTQREQEMPDLWDRIEQGFEEETKQIKNRNHCIQMKYMVLAAAVLLAIVIAVPVLIFNTRNTKDSDKHIVMEDTQAAIAEDVESAEYAGDMAADDVEYSDSMEMDGEAANGGKTAVESVDGAVTETAEETAGDEEYSYLLSGEDVIPSGSYEDIQCMLLQEVDADGTYGSFVYVNFDETEDDNMRKILAKYAILDREGSESDMEEQRSYMLGIKMRDGTIVTRNYTEKDSYGGHTFSQFAKEVFSLKK